VPHKTLYNRFVLWAAKGIWGDLFNALANAAGPPAQVLIDSSAGTPSLFAALDVATGAVIGKCYPRHRATEFRRFLDEIEKAVPSDLEVHLVIDNYATHKTPMIRDWLVKRPRWHVHHTPTGASWINQVERFFALLSEDAQGPHTLRVHLQEMDK
jgi:hypothetical protein